MIDGVSLKKSMTLQDFLILLLYGSTLLLAIPGDIRMFVSIFIVVGTLLLFGHPRFYHCMPLYIFFYSWIVLPGGLAGFRIYAILLILSYLNQKKMKVRKDLILSLLVITIYIMAVVFIKDIRIAVFMLVDIITVILFISISMHDKYDIQSFFKFYVMGAFLSGIFGALNKSSIDTLTYFNYNTPTDITRFSASFVDPNYAGLYFNIAIFIVISSGIIKKGWHKILVLMGLYICLFSTISMTSIICNILALTFYYFIFVFKIKEFHIDSVKIIGMVMLALLFLWLIRDTSIMKSNLYRINEKLSSLLVGNIKDVTTERASIWENHWIFYKNQPLVKILFGGNFLTDYGRDKIFEQVSHQVYIDWIINFGIVGTFTLLGSFLYKVGLYFEQYIKNSFMRNESKAFIMIAFIWVFYSFGLSMFPAWYFMILFFL